MLDALTDRIVGFYAWTVGGGLVALLAVMAFRTLEDHVRSWRARLTGADRRRERARRLVARHRLERASAHVELEVVFESPRHVAATRGAGAARQRATPTS